MIASDHGSGPEDAPASPPFPTGGAGRRVSIVGAGAAGAWQALMFARAGFSVTLYEAATPERIGGAGYWAGGMLAPDCEAEVSEPLITSLGHRSLALWREALPDTTFGGSLVVAHPRDRGELHRFARMTPGHRWLDADAIAELEPSLAGRFQAGLHFPAEGHVEPRRALPQLYGRLQAAGVEIHFGRAVDPDTLGGMVIDCRGIAARDRLPDLRGVKGEIVIVETHEVTLGRPLRLLHPRWPLYLIPRANGRFMIGATSLESDDEGMSLRSALELLSAAYAVHPAFGEARIIEFGAGLRPAFPDNDPRVLIEGGMIRVNGLYRHGFLLAPAVAEVTVRHILHQPHADGIVANSIVSGVMACA